MLELIIFVFVGTMAVNTLDTVAGVAAAHGLTIALLVVGFGNIRCVPAGIKDRKSTWAEDYSVVLKLPHS